MVQNAAKSRIEWVTRESSPTIRTDDQAELPEVNVLIVGMDRRGGIQLSCMCSPENVTRVIERADGPVGGRLGGRCELPDCRRFEASVWLRERADAYWLNQTTFGGTDPDTPLISSASGACGRRRRAIGNAARHRQSGPAGGLPGVRTPPTCHATRPVRIRWCCRSTATRTDRVLRRIYEGPSGLAWVRFRCRVVCGLASEFAAPCSLHV